MTTQFTITPKVYPHQKPATQHTPGPWLIRAGGDPRDLADKTIEIYSQASADKLGACEALCSILDGNKANARLIANAPETAKERDELRAECALVDVAWTREKERANKLEAQRDTLLAALKKAHGIIDVKFSELCPASEHELAKKMFIKMVDQMRAAIASVEKQL